MTTKLHASGIETSSSQGCPTVKVHLEQRGHELHLQMTDAFDRSGERDVRDVATAVALIESWTRQETEDGALPPISGAATADLSATIVPVSVAHHVARSGIAASFQSAIGSNGTTWVGGEVAACLRIGATCLGAAVRIAKDTRATGDSASFAQDSDAFEALATADLPRKLGSFVISPGIGVGYGKLAVVAHHHDALGNPLDMFLADHRLLVGAHLTVLRSIGSSVSLFGQLSADAAAARSDSSTSPGGSVRLSFGARFEGL